MVPFPFWADSSEIVSAREGLEGLCRERVRVRSTPLVVVKVSDRPAIFIPGYWSEDGDTASGIRPTVKSLSTAEFVQKKTSDLNAM